MDIKNKFEKCFHAQRRKLGGRQVGFSKSNQWETLHLCPALIHSHILNYGYFLHLPSGSCDLQYVLLIIYICCLFQLQSGHGGEKGRSELA